MCCRRMAARVPRPSPEAYVALADAVNGLLRDGVLTVSPLKDALAAISVGIVDGKPLLDLNYGEDSKADVDMNIVMTGSGAFVEVQGDC